MASFDTHAIFQTLQAHSLSTEQANGITAALAQALEATGQTVATKADLEGTRTALSTDLATTRTALQSETRELRVLMESRFQAVDSRFTFTHWMIGLTFTVLLGFSLGNLWLLINLLGRLPRP